MAVPTVTVRFNAERLTEVVLRRAERAMGPTQLEAVKCVKIELNHPGSGRTYSRGKNGRIHIASAPGETPAKDYGGLQSDVNLSADTFRQGNVVVSKVFDKADYAAALEFKPSENGGRPFMTSIPHKYGKRLVYIFQHFFNKA